MPLPPSPAPADLRPAAPPPPHPHPHPAWNPWLSLRFAVVVAFIFTMLNFALSSGDPSWATARGWWRAALTSLVFAVLIRGAIDLLYAAGRALLGTRLERMLPWQRYVFYWGTPLLGLAIALPLGNLVAGASGLADGGGPQLHTTPLGALVFMLLVISIFFGYFSLRGRQQRAEREAVEAQLKLLQGQIEPHFLFNTLANVVGLMEVDTPRAKAMLESFVDYLRSSLGGLRRAQHTLGDELELVDAYLRVIAIRMEGRLRYTIEVPEALRGFALPALIVQPLVENAVQHGLEPTIAGGSVHVAARLDDDGRTLVVSVADDGAGLAQAAQAGQAAPAARGGAGTALANIRERLVHTHGNAAGLRLEPVMPHGTRATLRLPARPVPPSPAAPTFATSPRP